MIGIVLIAFLILQFYNGQYLRLEREILRQPLIGNESSCKFGAENDDTGVVNSMFSNNNSTSSNSYNNHNNSYSHNNFSSRTDNENLSNQLFSNNNSGHYNNSSTIEEEDLRIVRIGSQDNSSQNSQNENSIMMWNVSYLYIV